MAWNGKECVNNAPPAPTPPSNDTSEASSGSGGGWRTAAIIGGGVLRGAGAVTGILAFSKKSKWSEACEDKHCYPSAQDDYDSGKLMANLSTGTFIVGAAVLTAGLFLIPGASSPADERPVAGKPYVNIAVGPHGAGIGSRWVF